MGIGQMGGGLSFAYTIWVQYVILHMGWRLTFLVLAGVLVAALLPLYLLAFYYRPRDKGSPRTGRPTSSARPGETRLGPAAPCRRSANGRWRRF